MSMTVQTLNIARANIKDVFIVEANHVPAQYKDVVGNMDSTTQSYETMKQLAGLEPAQITPEGEDAKADDLLALFSRNFIPFMVTKLVRYSKLMQFTNQYKEVLALQPQFARAFMAKKNQVFANLDNLGFTDTTYGMNSEVLYSTSHSMGAQTAALSNRPATDIAFGPLALWQAMTELRKQKGARGIPMPILGKILVKLPAALEPLGVTVVNSQNLQGTADNDENTFIRRRVEMAVIDYYTSDTAWFIRAMDNAEHGLFGLEQMPYDIEQLARGKDLMDSWVASESYTAGWKDAHGTWGTVGA